MFSATQLAGAGLLLLLRIVAQVSAEEDFQFWLEDSYRFKTRPEIEAPRWKITAPDPDALFDGYTFVSAYKELNQGRAKGAPWIAPYIYDKKGELIWSGAHLSHGQDIFDFHLSRVNGEDMITMISQANRTAYAYDTAFNLRHTFPIAGQGEEVNMHEMQFYDDGKKAYYFYDRTHTMTSDDLASVGFTEKNCPMRDSGFRELDVVKNETIRDWILHEHVLPAENRDAPYSPRQKCQTDWDYAHVNSLDRFPDGGYLLSARHTDTIYRIGRDGDIVWRLGGKTSDFIADFTFSRQQDAHVIESNDTTTIISFFDNAADEGRLTVTANCSRVLIVALRTDLPHGQKQASLLGEIQHPDGFGSYTVSYGSVQMLPNGNFLINWVDGMLMAEYAPDGSAIAEARVRQDWIKTYRTYKHSFIGYPAAQPDVFAACVTNPVTNKVHTLVYVSWNGATEVKKWRAYRTDAAGGGIDTLDPEASESRTGFETFLTFSGYSTHVVVEAVDFEGFVIRQSNITATVSDAQTLSTMSNAATANGAVTVAGAGQTGAEGAVTTQKVTQGAAGQTGAKAANAAADATRKAYAFGAAAGTGGKISMFAALLFFVAAAVAVHLVRSKRGVSLRAWLGQRYQRVADQESLTEGEKRSSD